jgi:hypothetical protein
LLDGLIWSERTRQRFNPEERHCMSAAAKNSSDLGCRTAAFLQKLP